MSKPETWIQVYRGQSDPGPDGKPNKPSDWFQPTVWSADRITMRLERGIEQQWRRVR